MMPSSLHGCIVSVISKEAPKTRPVGQRSRQKLELTKRIRESGRLRFYELDARFSKSILKIQSEHRESYYFRPIQINSDQGDCNYDGEEKGRMGQSL